MRIKTGGKMYCCYTRPVYATVSSSFIHFVYSTKNIDILLKVGMSIVDK